MERKKKNEKSQFLFILNKVKETNFTDKHLNYPYLLRNGKKIGEDHFQHPWQSFGWGIRIFLLTNPKTVQIQHPPFVFWIVYLAADD